MSSKVALLVDAENISYQSLPQILTLAARQGEIVLQAIYGDWDKPSLQPWREIAEENNFILRHQTSHPNIKNSSDMRLIMDAIEVLYRVSVDTFCLVTNDADYVPLCEKLHESGKEVIGIGYKQASDALVAACDQFMLMRRAETPAQSVINTSTEVQITESAQPNHHSNGASAPKAATSKLEKLLSQAFAAVPHENDGWVDLSALGASISKIQKGFKPGTHGHSTLSKLLENMPHFVEVKKTGATKSARLKK